MKSQRDAEKRRISGRLALTGAVLLLGLASIAGVFANFTDTQAAGPEPITTGQVHIVLGTPAGDHGAITVGPINNMAQGDSVARVVQLTNNTTISAAGQTGLAAVNGLTLATSVSGTNAGGYIVTDTTNGLHVTVQSCATAPTEAGGVAGPWTYTCGGAGFTTVVNNVAVATLDAATTDITSSAPTEGNSVYYVITVTLPNTVADAYSTNGGVCSASPTVGEQLMNCSLSVTYNFTATQRAGTND